MVIIFSVFTNLIWTMTELLPKKKKTVRGYARGYAENLHAVIANLVRVLPYFHCAKGGQVSLEVITSKDVQFSAKNQKNKKKVITSADV